MRLDQVVAAEGDRLWYDYDFGDDWTHLLRVEKVLDTPPSAPRCIKGRLACPPEDCGGVWGYQELADWARGGFEPASLPEMFSTLQEARKWLPLAWDPDAFDLDDTNHLIGLYLADDGYAF